MPSHSACYLRKQQPLRPVVFKQQPHTESDMAADVGSKLATPGGEDLFDVFLSHAGEQKKTFVDCLHQILVRAGGRGEHRTERFNVFLDQHALQFGVAAWEVMQHAARTCRVGVPFSPFAASAAGPLQVPPHAANNTHVGAQCV
jgi:hypothetical protein